MKNKSFLYIKQLIFIKKKYIYIYILYAHKACVLNYKYATLCTINTNNNYVNIK